MGQGETKIGSQSVPEVSVDSFDFLLVIGEGGFSKVWKAQYKKLRKYIAIKEMSKIKIIEKNVLNNILSEKELLSTLQNDFIVNMYCSFQDTENLYLVMDYLSGGDLRFYQSTHKIFQEDQLKFLIGCIILGVEYLHSNGIIHRDLKPENIICDERGYFHITDLGIAKRINTHILVTSDITGTPGYIAPEAVLSKKCSYECDYFSIGVILYELLMYQRPFTADNKADMSLEFKSKEIKLQPKEIPKEFHRNEICDFINRLLIADPEKRLGHDGIYELKQHPWFNGFNWEGLKNRKIISSFIPKLGEFRFRTNLSSKFSLNYSEEQINKILSDEQFQNKFSTYTYLDKIKKDYMKYIAIGASFFKEHFTLKNNRHRSTKNIFLQGYENMILNNKENLNTAQNPIVLRPRRANSKQLSSILINPKLINSNSKPKPKLLINTSIKPLLKKSSSSIMQFKDKTLSAFYQKNLTANNSSSDRELPQISQFSPYGSPSQRKHEKSPDSMRTTRFLLSTNGNYDKKMSLNISNKALRKKVSVLIKRQKLFL